MWEQKINILQKPFNGESYVVTESSQSDVIKSWKK